jgi:hypothetical protein
LNEEHSTLAFDANSGVKPACIKIAAISF